VRISRSDAKSGSQKMRSEISRPDSFFRQENSVVL